jgi:hypothetical protein
MPNSLPEFIVIVVPLTPKFFLRTSNVITWFAGFNTKSVALYINWLAVDDAKRPGAFSPSSNL